MTTNPAYDVVMIGNPGLLMHKQRTMTSSEISITVAYSQPMLYTYIPIFGHNHVHTIVLKLKVHV